MNSVISHLLSGGPVTTDGAWGTQLQARGLAVGECPEIWNLLHPDKVEEVARAYVAAGSRVVLTNTFGSNRINLQRHGLAEKMVELNRLGTEISVRVARGSALVFASIGPSGKMLMTGDTTEDELHAAFTEQTRVIARAGANGFVIESMADLEEARIALTAARETGLPVAVSMVFDSGKDQDRTMMGVTPEQAAEALADEGADVIGANCGHGITGFIPICRRLHAATAKPIWIKPNAGMPKMVDGRATYDTTPDEFAQHVPDLIKAGASFLGGCCGTTPDFIRAIKRAVSP